MAEQSSTSDRLHRLDKFIVPNEPREEFLAKVRSIHELLRDQPGFIQDFLLEKPHTAGEFTLVTLVEWQDMKAVQGARAAVLAMQQSTGFNPRYLMARLGVKADQGTYKQVNR